MTRRTLLAAPALLLARKTVAPKPNVLFIAADDMNNALGCYGHPLAKTPNVDRLAQAGIRFDRAYCQYPLCGPSRASVLSGLRPDTTKVLANDKRVRETVPGVVTMPELFRKQGYVSARFGKIYHMDLWDPAGKIDLDDRPSWDSALTPEGPEGQTRGEGRNITPRLMPGEAMHWISFAGKGGEQIDQQAVDRAAEFIHANKSKPFFMGLGFLRPHLPHVAPSRFFDLYPLDKIKPAVNPANDRDDIPQASEKAINTRANDMGMTDADKPEAIRGYYASVSYMDFLLGQAIDALDRAGVAGRTVVVFWGDHGWHLGEHFRWQKRSLFEESARAPLIVASPGQKAKGTSTKALVELVDIYPTLAELCGLNPPANLEGQSFVPLLSNPRRPWKRAAFTQVTGAGGIVGRSVRTERHRYIRWSGPLPGEELYDERDDPREFHNMAADSANRPLVAKLSETLDQGWRAAKASATSARFDLPNTNVGAAAAGGNVSSQQAGNGSVGFETCVLN